MDAIGQVASGVAHDLNNLLSVILTCAQMLDRDPQVSPVSRQYIGEIVEAVERAATLTRHFLAFSQQERTMPTRLDLNEVVGNVRLMLQRLAGEGVAIETMLQSDLGKIRGDPRQIERILMNLVANARDAVPRGGQVQIRTANVDLEDRNAETHLGITPGRHVLLAVSDDGVGMDEATRARAFEPFFTTKEKGTGLGLSTVCGVVQQSEGSIRIQSEPGHGTTIEIYFPRIDTADANRSAPMPGGTDPEEPGDAAPSSRR
jgi:signal transduction histidine kinase